MLLIQLVDALNLYSLLSDGSESHTAKQLKGIYDRGQPLLQLGTVFVTADVAFSFMINGLFSCTAFEIEGTNDAAILTANTVPS